MSDYLAGYYTNINPLIFLEAEKKYKKNCAYIPFSKLEKEEIESMGYDDYNLVDRLVDQGLQNLVEDIFTKFSKNLNSIDLTIFTMKLNKNVKNEDIIAKTGLKLSAINDRYQEIQYRVLAYIIVDNRLMYDNQFLINTFNRKEFKKYNKKFLKVEAIKELPTKEQLTVIFMKDKSKQYKDNKKGDLIEYKPQYPTLDNYDLLHIAKCFDTFATICSSNNYDDSPNSPKYRSRKDKNGERHKKYVTFINSQGWAYDFVTKETFYLGSIY